MDFFVNPIGGVFFSVPGAWIAYAAPILDSVSGCTDQGSTTVECPRNGGTVIVLKGEHFGKDSAVVIVNGAICEFVEHEPTDKHGQLSCTVGPGVQLDLSVLIIQAGLTSNVGLISYDQCNPGSYQLSLTDYDCTPCARGSFTNQEGQFSCAECSPGTVAADPGALTCVDCAKGKAQSSGGQATCDECDPGDAMNDEGAKVCIACVPGKYSDDVAFEICTDCAEGTALAATGGTECIACTAGKFSNEVGLALCKEPPVLTLLQMSSSAVPTSGNVLLTLVGTSFDSDGTVLVGGRACAVGSWDVDQVVCTLPAGDGASQVVYLTTVATKNSNELTIDYDKPAISQLLPTAAVNTEAGVLLTIKGDNFGLSGSVKIGEVVCPHEPADWTHSQIICTVAPLVAGDSVAAGFGEVVATSSEQSSNGIVLGINQATLSSITDLSGSTAGTYSVVIAGNSLGDGTVPVSVTVAGSDCDVTLRSHLSITCTMPVGAGPGDEDVIVRVIGRPATTSLVFTYNDPQITSVDPVDGLAAIGGTRLTIHGESFGTSGTVALNGVNCPVVTGEYSHTQIVCLAVAGGGSGKAVAVTVGTTISNNDYTTAYAPPTITDVDPLEETPAGGVEITVTGTEFGPSTAITLGGQECSVTSRAVTGDEVICFLPAGNGVGKEIVLDVSGQSVTATQVFDYFAPEINSVSPGGGSTEGGFTVNVGGQYFSTTGTINVLISGSLVECIQLPVNEYTATLVKCIFPEGSGTVPVTITVGGQTSNAVDYTYGIPSITLLFPDNGPTDGKCVRCIAFVVCVAVWLLSLCCVFLCFVFLGVCCCFW
jgi:hypothetical protein